MGGGGPDIPAQPIFPPTPSMASASAPLAVAGGANFGPSPISALGSAGGANLGNINIGNLAGSGLGSQLALPTQQAPINLPPNVLQAPNAVNMAAPGGNTLQASQATGRASAPAVPRMPITRGSPAPSAPAPVQRTGAAPKGMSKIESLKSYLNGLANLAATVATVKGAFTKQPKSKTMGSILKGSSIGGLPAAGGTGLAPLGGINISPMMPSNVDISSLLAHLGR